jgi:hypothetical protein
VITVTGRSPFEMVHRAVKLQKLLAASDEIVKAVGFDPTRDAEGVLRFWREATADHFKALVAHAKVNPPSQITFDAFFGVLAARAREVQS